jgi:uncharacterized protein (TIGR03435 family)
LASPVIDRTGLTGTFNIHLEWTLDADISPLAETGAVSDPPGTSLIAAIRTQPGISRHPVNKRESPYLSAR